MINIEKQIAEEIAKANGFTVTKLGLRFDKVVVRLFADLRASVEKDNPQNKTIIVTITAPIKLPAKTEQEIESQIKEFLESEISHKDCNVVIFQNEVRIRIAGSSSKQAPRFIGLVHNPSIDSMFLLDLATQWLAKS